ncbi:putative RNA-dependent RNA polymerase 1 [Dorcoceras hygrometricum]|uniref:Putative RNA-dependent RNA polymerase 1 n=1 Tax=Dorcoceras hygrometricum TaxID=472368 RepID=A0A2Z7CPB6_9LAMI|nr:putative RNA-dependent RNA polymerase 1 [Dorcoceras hygrometricum]
MLGEAIDFCFSPWIKSGVLEFWLEICSEVSVVHRWVLPFSSGDLVRCAKTSPFSSLLAFHPNLLGTCVTLNGSGIQLAVGPQPLRLRNHNFGLAHRIMVKRLATSPHDPLDITDSACKNQLVVVSVQYGPFNTYIPIRSTTIGESRVARDPIAMHTSWISNSDITSVTR